MTAKNTARIIRGPGTLLINPTSLDPEAPGGTILGSTRNVYLMPFHDGFTQWAEEWGEPRDVLEPHTDWAAGAFLRGWDDDAVGHVFGDTEAGAVSQHAVHNLPGDRLPGQRISTRAATLLFLPDNPRDVPGAIFYTALPVVEASARLAFQYGEDVGFPAIWRFVRDSRGLIGKVGRLWDLSL